MNHLLILKLYYRDISHAAFSVTRNTDESVTANCIAYSEIMPHVQGYDYTLQLTNRQLNEDFG